MIGTWKNIQELEESLTLAELEAIIKAARDKEHRHNKFMAALKGVNIDDEVDASEKFKEIQRRADARLRGIETPSEDDIEREEFAELGIEIEVEQS